MTLRMNGPIVSAIVSDLQVGPTNGKAAVSHHKNGGGGAPAEREASEPNRFHYFLASSQQR